MSARCPICYKEMHIIIVSLALVLSFIILIQYIIYKVKRK